MMTMQGNNTRGKGGMYNEGMSAAMKSGGPEMARNQQTRNAVHGKV